MSNKFRFAIIGAGVIATLHAKAILLHPYAELAAIVDSVREKAQNLADEYNVANVYENIHEMLKNCEIDAVCICLPSGLHSEATIAAAEAGKHVLCEKPLDITLEKMDAMIAACRNNNVKLATVFQKRLSELAIQTRKAVQEGKLGKLVLGDAYLKYYRSPEYYQSAEWRGTWALDGGCALMNQGIHGIDIIRWIMGDVESVFAYAAPLVRDIEVEDTAVAVIKYKNGAFGVIQGATSVNPGQELRFEIHGEHGSIIYGDSGFKVWKTTDGEQPPAITDKKAEATDNPLSISNEGHYFLIDDLIHAVRDNREPYVSGEEARKSVELVLAIYESSRTGKEIIF